jgi:uncharacterized cupredoxin-like copper-binding protein
MIHLEDDEMNSTSVAVFFVSLALFSTAQAVRANDDDGNHAGMNHSAEAAAETEGAESDGAAKAWAALRATQDAIAADVSAGRLGEIHEKSEALAPQGRALIEASGFLDPDKRARVEGALEQLPDLANALHEAADAGQKAGTDRQLKRLGALLELVRAQYPPEALSAAVEAVDHAAMGHGTGGHGRHGTQEGSAAGHTHGNRPLAAVATAARSTITVVSNEFAFEPKIVELKAGEPTRIELVNHGKIDHAFVVAEPNGKGDWIHLHALAGETDAATFQIDSPGRYKILCTIAGHVEAGMVGEVVVETR